MCVPVSVVFSLSHLLSHVCAIASISLSPLSLSFFLSLSLSLSLPLSLSLSLSLPLPLSLSLSPTLSVRACVCVYVYVSNDDLRSCKENQLDSKMSSSVSEKNATISKYIYRHNSHLTIQAGARQDQHILGDHQAAAGHNQGRAEEQRSRARGAGRAPCCGN